MKKIRFGVVGTNFITDKIIAAGRLDPRFELSAVCSRTASRADEFAAKHGIPHKFTSLEEMASSPVVDAVYIASPNSAHAEQSILCLRRGKHVLCEKPLAANAREVRAMIDMARRSGKLLMEAMKPTLTPNFGRVREYLPKIGKVRHYFAAFGKYSSRYDDLKAGALPNAFNPLLANGAVMDIGIYAVYPMAVLFGRPQTVQATVIKLESGVDGHGAVDYSYGDMAATTLYSKIADLPLPFEIVGEDGTIRGDAIHTIMKVEYRPRGDRWEDITVSGHSGDDYSYEMSHFMDLIADGRTESPVNTLDASLAAMEIMDEIRRQGGIEYPADSGDGAR